MYKFKITKNWKKTLKNISATTIQVINRLHHRYNSVFATRNYVTRS